MSKRNGLGMYLFVGGYDLSGDVGQLDALETARGLQDVTTINDSGRGRLHLQKGGRIAFTGFFDDAALAEHDALKLVPTADVVGTVLFSSTLGDVGCGLTGKRVGYPFTRNTDGSLGWSNEILSNNDDLHYGKSLTAGKRTDTGAANGTGVDMGAGAAINIAGSNANDQVETATAHGLTTGDRVLIASHDADPTVNGIRTVTVVDTTHFTTGVNITTGGTAVGTVTPVSTRFGLVAFLHVFSVTGTSITVSIEESADDAATDAYAAVTGGAFTVVAAAAISGQRIETSLTQVVERYLRAVSAGTFNPATFAVVAKRYASASREL
jgi:hypothetical protein